MERTYDEKIALQRKYRELKKQGIVFNKSKYIGSFFYDYVDLRSNGMTEEMIEQFYPLCHAIKNSDDRFYDHSVRFATDADGADIMDSFSIPQGCSGSQSQRRKYREECKKENKPDDIPWSWIKPRQYTICENDTYFQDETGYDEEVTAIMDSFSEEYIWIVKEREKGTKRTTLAEELGVTPPAMTKRMKKIEAVFLPYAEKYHLLTVKTT